ncbi:Hypothetical predicted protein, partial [Paramuricea clavata]
MTHEYKITERYYHVAIKDIKRFSKSYSKCYLNMFTLLMHTKCDTRDKLTIHQIVFITSQGTDEGVNSENSQFSRAAQKQNITMQAFQCVNMSTSIPKNGATGTDLCYTAFGNRDFCMRQ